MKIEKPVIVGIETTFKGRLEKLLTTLFANGYLLTCPPTFVGNKVPLGETALAGWHPHFLVVLQKLPSTPKP